MRKIFATALIMASAAFADQATLFGQQILSSGQIKFGAVFSKTLYITGSSPHYLVDSGAVPTRVRLDTAVNSTGLPGASSASLLIQTVAGISQQSFCEISYRIRATDVNQDSILLTAVGRYRTPWTDTDTSWSSQGYLWGQDTVKWTHTPPSPTTSFSTRRWYFMPAGDDLRINVQRANVGSGDTVAIKMEARCR